VIDQGVLIAVLEEPAERNLAKIRYTDDGKHVERWTSTGNFTELNPEEQAEIERKFDPSRATGPLTDAATELVTGGETPGALTDTGYSGEVCAWVTLVSSAQVQVLAKPGAGDVVGRLRPGAHVAWTGERTEAGETEWLQVVLTGGTPGWLDRQQTERKAVEEALAVRQKQQEELEADRREAIQYADEGFDAGRDPRYAIPPGLSVLRHLAPRALGPAAVFADIARDQTIGSWTPTALWDSLPEIGPGNAERREVLFGRRPGFVLRAAFSPRTELDRLVSLGILSEGEFKRARGELDKLECKNRGLVLMHVK